MDLKDLRTATISIESGDDRACLQYTVSVKGVIAHAIDPIEMLGWYFENYRNPENPIIGLMSEDGTRGLETYIDGFQRLVEFRKWVSKKYGSNCSRKLLKTYWAEFEKYEQHHVMDLYSRPVTDENRHLYATWAQAEEYMRTEFYDGDDEEWEEAKKRWYEEQRAHRDELLG